MKRRKTGNLFALGNSYDSFLTPGDDNPLKTSQTIDLRGEAQLWVGPAANLSRNPTPSGTDKLFAEPLRVVN